MAINYNYHVGHEGFFAIAPEPGFFPNPGADSAALGTLVTSEPSGFKLAGYTDLPEISNDRGAAGVKAVGAYQEVDAYQTQNEYTLGSQLTLCASDTTVANTLIGAACRSTEEDWGDNRILGLPLVAIATGFISDYDVDAVTGSSPSPAVTRSQTILGRYALVNTLKIAAKEKSPVTADVELWPLFTHSSTGTLAASDLGMDNFQEVLTWNTLALTIGDDDYRGVVSSVSIDINNNCARTGIRPIYSGNAEPLSLTPYSILPGTQTSQLQLELHTELGAELKVRSVGTVTMTATGMYDATIRTLTVTIPDVTFTSGSRQKGQPDEPVMYSASFLARNVTVAWS